MHSCSPKGLVNLAPALTSHLKAPNGWYVSALGLIDGLCRCSNQNLRNSALAAAAASERDGDVLDCLLASVPVGVDDPAGRSLDTSQNGVSKTPARR